jgi:galactose mutarotase-like enzyme
MTIADGFHDGEALGPGTWTKVEKIGMKLEITITIGGESFTAQAIIGDDEKRAAKTREALVANGWTKAITWPQKGAKIRVSVKTKGEYQNVYVCKPGGGGGEPVAASDVEKFLAAERGEGPIDPFAG